MSIGDWTWLNFANVPGLLDWIAFVLGGAGLLFAISQLLRSKSALDAARDALVSTQTTLVRNQLVAILPLFETMSAEIDRAVIRNKRDATDQALQRFAIRAHESSTLLRATTSEFDEIVEEIVRSSDAAIEARSGLFSNPGVDVIDIAGNAATQIRNLVPRMSGMATTLRNNAGGIANA